MILTILSWTLWPLSVTIFVAFILHFADVNNPVSVYTTTGRTFLIALVVLLGLELVLPYREKFHRIHHSADFKQGNSNYGVTLPLKTEAREMGIEGDPIPHRLLPELLSPLRLNSWKQDWEPASRESL